MWVISIFMKNSKAGSIKCAFCGVKNRRGREYCWKCGKPLIPVVYEDN